MKTIKILLLLLLISSCSKSDVNECECIKYNYEIQSVLISAPNTTPQLSVERVLVGTETVECQEEREGYSTDGELYYNIECN